MRYGEKIRQALVEIILPDGSVYGFPVEVVARNRAAYYAKREYDGDIEASLADDTWPLFESDDYNIVDWLMGDMNYEDFAQHLKLLRPAPENILEKLWNDQACKTNVVVNDRKV